jgi:hypothetical protein
MKVKNIGLTVVVLLGLFLSSEVSGENRKACENRVKTERNIAVGTAAGTATGALVGASACLGFLGAAFFDFGFSYGTCVTVVTALGGGAGAIASDSYNDTELKKCSQLSE